MTLGRPLQLASAVMMLTLLMTGSVVLRAQDEPAAPSFVSLKFEGACDAKNNRLWLTNSHSFKTVAATVRWHADGGKDLIDRFFAAPNSVREIGCAADADIVEAKFADF